MREPRQYFLDAFDLWPIGQGGPRDHDHGQAKLARGVDLGVGAGPAGIARHQKFDASRTHQFAIALKRERSTRDDDFGIWQRQRPIGRTDKAQRIGVLRLSGERRDVLPADGEEHFCRRLGQRSERGGDVGDFDPGVAGRLRPRRALERDQRRSRLRARLDRVAAHLGSEGMRGVDRMRDALTANIVGKPAHAAEAADAGRQRLIGGRAGSAAIGIHGVDARACDFRGEQARIGGSAQNEGARHG